MTHAQLISVSKHVAGIAARLPKKAALLHINEAAEAGLTMSGMNAHHGARYDSPAFDKVCKRVVRYIMQNGVAPHADTISRFILD